MQEQKAEFRRSTKLKISTVCCSTTLCCCSSPEEADPPDSDRYPSISTLAHYLVQEKLDQMIKQSEEDQARRLSEARKGKQKISNDSNSNVSSRSLVMLVAMEKCTQDPRAEFRQSMVEVILKNRITRTKDLRCLLSCYLEMNSEECRAVILEAFHQVCTDIFLCFKC